MNKKLLFFRLFVLVAAMMCALGMQAQEAYANYTPSDSTLTFYYDNMRSSRTGTTYDLNTGTHQPGWYSDIIHPKVTQVVFNSTFANARPTTTYYWFRGMSKLRSITGLNYLNTTNVTDMSSMFNDCQSLTSLDLSSFNTAKVTTMSEMFYYCKSLTSLNLSSFNTANVTTMESMFYQCSSLTSLDLSSFNTAKVTTMRSMFMYCTKLTSLNLGSFNTSNVTDMEDMFNLCMSLTSLNLSSFNTVNVTTMSSMFYNCTKLTSLNLGSLKTANVTDMSFMFYNCSSLTSLNLGSFNTANVTDMHNMFGYNKNLETIYVGQEWSTANVTSSYEMFDYCISLVGGMGTTYKNSNPKDKTYAHIDGGTSNPGYFTDKNAVPEAYACYTSGNTTLTFYYDNQRSSRTGTTYDLPTTADIGWYQDGSYPNVTKVVFDPSFAGARPTKTYAWFRNMENLQTITGMSYLNTSAVTTMYFMFRNCSSLTTLDLSGFNTANVTNMQAMFMGCSNLQTIYVGEQWSTDAVTTSTFMFSNCTSLVGGKGTAYNDSNPKDKTYAHIDGGPSNPGYFTDKNEPVAYACYTPSNTTLTFYYDTQRGSRPGTAYSLNTGANKPDWNTDNCCNSVTTVVFDPSFAAARPTSTSWWFGWMGNLTSIEGIEHLNTSEVTNMSNMFSTCWSMEEFDLSHFDTRNVADMSYMFNYCEGLTSLDLSSFNTSNVYTMEGMFYECSGLSSLDLGNFNTEHVNNFNEMFFDCTGLTSLDLRSFDTQGAQTMEGMFMDCSGLTSIDLSSFNTELVDNMSSMFSGCTNLTTLDLTNFNTSYLLTTDWMFNYCRNLRTIYVGDDWNTGSLDSSEGMFMYCVSLVGGQGTTYDANHVDDEYAHIDGGPSNPGYFTDKNASLRGDVNGDNDVTIADVSALIDYLLDNSNIINMAGANCNADDEITIADVSALIDYLLAGTW